MLSYRANINPRSFTPHRPPRPLPTGHHVRSCPPLILVDHQERGDHQRYLALTAPPPSQWPCQRRIPIVLAYRDPSGPTIAASSQSPALGGQACLRPHERSPRCRSEHRLRHHQHDGRREPEWSRPPASAATETSQHIDNSRSYTPSRTYPSRVRLVNAAV